MSEQQALYTTPTTDPPTVEEFRADKHQFNQTAVAQANVMRLEKNLREIQEAAWDVCRLWDELAHNPADNKVTDFTPALKHLAGLISYPVWYQL